MALRAYIRAAIWAATVVAAGATARAETVTVHIDATAAVKPISRYIYGVNGTLGGQHANLTFRRVGGNRWTAYNWANNASNAGSATHAPASSATPKAMRMLHIWCQ